MQQASMSMCHCCEQKWQAGNFRNVGTQLIQAGVVKELISSMRPVISAGLRYQISNQFYT